jgi:hypothetical protein
MEWVDNISDVIVSFNTPTGQNLTYTQPSPSSSTGGPGDAFPSTTFTITKSGATLSGTASIAGLPSGITYTQSYDNTNVGNTLTITFGGLFPGVSSINTNLVVSGLTVTVDVSFNTPTGQSLTYTQPSPQSSSGDVGSSFTTTTFTVTDPNSGTLSGTASISGLPTGITYTQSYDNSNPENTLTITLGGVFPDESNANIDLVLSGLTITAAPFSTDFLVVAGGGAGGGAFYGGGGGAGGLRTSYGSTSGGGASAESSLTLNSGVNYTVTVGAGGSGNNNASGDNGGVSVFYNKTSTGGGGGGGSQSTGGDIRGKNGGSGGAWGAYGDSNTRIVGSRVSGQGYAGGGSNLSSNPYSPGGGGAGGVGAQGTDTGAGGSGLSVSITGTAVGYAGGGGGSTLANANSANVGGFGGGGNGGRYNSYNNNTLPQAGGTNKGGGGGGGVHEGSNSGGAGGSGVVILRYPSWLTITETTSPSVLTFTTATDGSDKVTTFTAGQSGTIQFS